MDDIPEEIEQDIRDHNELMRLREADARYLMKTYGWIARLQAALALSLEQAVRTNQDAVSVEFLSDTGRNVSLTLAVGDGAVERVGVSNEKLGMLVLAMDLDSGQLWPKPDEGA